MVIKRIAYVWLVAAFLIVGIAGLASFAPQVILAAPGGGILVPDQENELDASSARVSYLDQGLKTPVAATEITSVPRCSQGKYQRYRVDFTITGTMTGSGSLVTNGKVYNSIDGGANWQTKATMVAVDTTAITTPANLAQSFTFGETFNAANPVVLGDCWKVGYTVGGTSPGVNLGVKGYNE